MTAELISQALSSDHESASIEFKTTFNPDSDADWCELIKDVVAIANTEGGIIVIGLSNSGAPEDSDLSRLKTLDPAHLADKIFRFTGTNFADFRFRAIEKDGIMLFAIVIDRSLRPLVFERAGTYISGTRERTAFAKGTIYFRHGAKSEPCDNEDLRRVIDRNLEAVRSSWMNNLRQVIEAPIGSTVITLPPNATVSLTDAQATHSVRLEDSPGAIPVTVTEEDIRKIAPFDYRSLTRQLRGRYSDFVENLDYHRLRKSIESNPKFCRVRFLDPKNPKSGRKNFYTNAIIAEFDKHYTRRGEPP